MAFYHDIVLPKMCDLSMRNRHLIPYRRRIVGSAEGRVLEIGVGSGLNLPYYRPTITEIIGLEPSRPLVSLAKKAASGSPCPVGFIEGSAEAIPLDSGSVDTVVTTWTLCTIQQGVIALGEMRRVLKPGGRLLFVEHGLSPDSSVRRWQNWLTPAWTCISGGCHLNRPMRSMIEGSGFRLERLETGYMPGPRPMTFMYEGIARPG